MAADSYDLGTLPLVCAAGGASKKYDLKCYRYRDDGIVGWDFKAVVGAHA